MVCQVKSLVPVIGDSGFALAPDQTAAQVSYTQYSGPTVSSSLSALHVGKVEEVALTTTYSPTLITIDQQVQRLGPLGFVLGGGSAYLSLADSTNAGLFSPAEKTKLAALVANYKGVFSTLANLQTAYPTSTNGDWAIVTNPAGPSQHYTWDGTQLAWEAVDFNAITGQTNLSYTPSASSGVVNSDTGTDALIPLVDATNAGLASPSMKTSWDGAATAAAANAAAIAAIDYQTYVKSRGNGVVTNYSGHFHDNTNFSAWTFSGDNTPGTEGSFVHTGYGAFKGADELIPVDPSAVMKTEICVYLAPSLLPTAGLTYADRHRQYGFFYQYDVDDLEILAAHHMRLYYGGVDSYTTLTAPLTPGDTTVSVADASGWQQGDITALGTYQKTATIFEYKNSLGYKYDYYSRLQDLTWVMIDINPTNLTTNTITFQTGMPATLGNPDDPNGTWPIGSKIANSSAGSTYKYSILNGTYITSTGAWYKVTGHIGGVDHSGKNSVYNFSPGCVKIKPGFLINYTNSATVNVNEVSDPNQKVYISNLKVYEDQQSIVGDNADGSKSILTNNISAGGVHSVGAPVGDLIYVPI